MSAMLLLDGARSSACDHLCRKAAPIAAAGLHEKAHEGVAAFLTRCRPDVRRA
ncbi:MULTISPECIES: hypothetical protein [Sphingomonas]|uniref:hypothetical protein n=1 Tax=Sphingomonas TaxID=13687 RepID=UPI000B2DA9C6|nr:MULTISPECIES: hypothetical protein [Sphingomonas]MBY0302789.1 hypothetical protein [Sphingomonas ginsenosidimutans]